MTGRLVPLVALSPRPDGAEVVAVYSKAPLVAVVMGFARDQAGVHEVVSRWLRRGVIPLGVLSGEPQGGVGSPKPR